MRSSCEHVFRFYSRSYALSIGCCYCCCKYCVTLPTVRWNSVIRLRPDIPLLASFSRPKPQQTMKTKRILLSGVPLLLLLLYGTAFGNADNTEEIASTPEEVSLPGMYPPFV